MKCTLCCIWDEKIQSCKNYSDAFTVKGCTNYRVSVVQDHNKSDQHLKATEEKQRKEVLY